LDYLFIVDSTTLVHSGSGDSDSDDNDGIARGSVGGGEM